MNEKVVTITGNTVAVDPCWSLRTLAALAVMAWERGQTQKLDDAMTRLDEWLTEHKHDPMSAIFAGTDRRRG